MLAGTGKGEKRSHSDSRVKALQSTGNNENTSSQSHLFLWMGTPGLRDDIFQSQETATVRRAQGTTPTKLPGGLVVLDLMNLGHRELPQYVCVCLRQSTLRQPLGK